MPPINKYALYGNPARSKGNRNISLSLFFSLLLDVVTSSERINNFLRLFFHIYRRDTSILIVVFIYSRGCHARRVKTRKQVEPANQISGFQCNLVNFFFCVCVCDLLDCSVVGSHVVSFLFRLSLSVAISRQGPLNASRRLSISPSSDGFTPGEN